MNEYSLEMKWKWMVDMHCFPQNGPVSRLIEEVPKPKQSKLKNSLPLWDLLPLDSKLPDLGIKGVYFTRGKAGTSVIKAGKNVDFITYDPNCYEHDSLKYDSLHDRHLINYFKSGKICNFLRRIGILDKENYPKCSLADLNAFRFYLNRIHKCLVKNEFNRLLEEAEERKEWKAAHQGAIKSYFQNLKKENAIMKRAPQRRQRAKEERAKAMEPHQRMKRWHRRLAERAEQKRDNDILKDELIDRERKRYQRVLENGKKQAMQRRLNTILKMKKKKELREEKENQRKDVAALEANKRTESFVFNKTLAQFDKIEWVRQLALFRNKSNYLDQKRRTIKLKRQRQRFANYLKCRKRRAPRKVVSISIKKPFGRKKDKAKFQKNVKDGVNFIVQSLIAIESKHFPKKKKKSMLSNQQDNIASSVIRKVAQQLIKRAIYNNLNFICKHFAAILLHFFLEPTQKNNKLHKVPNFQEAFNYFPSEQCLRNAMIMKEMQVHSENLVINGKRIIETFEQKMDTSGLRAYLVKKQKLLITMLLNAKRLFDLTNDRIKLLKIDCDPYKNIPRIKEEIMKARKEMNITVLLKKLVSLLTSTDPKVFNSPLSGLGEIANLLAYSKVLSDRKIILTTTLSKAKKKERAKERPSFDKKIPSAFIWERMLELHKFFKEEYNKLDLEEQESGENKEFTTWSEFGAEDGDILQDIDLNEVD